ncbi:MAG: Lrp/AsnC family transcriptional regulator [Meiothermus sp.]|nr:Lrp/AsnC family transcriptional regulator [Meiothermus sp.]
MDYTSLDQTDREIVTFLQEDGRMPFREIGRRLGVSEGTVRRRYERMVEGGLLRVLATGDPMKFGVKVDALTLVKTQPGKVESVAEALSGLEAVRYVGIGIGSADVVIESLHPSMEALYRFLTQVLPAISGVSSYETIQIAKILKSEWDWKAWLRRSDVEEVGV